MEKLGKIQQRGPNVDGSAFLKPWISLERAVLAVRTWGSLSSESQTTHLYINPSIQKDELIVHFSHSFSRGIRKYDNSNLFLDKMIFSKVITLSVQKSLPFEITWDK